MNKRQFLKAFAGKKEQTPGNQRSSNASSISLSPYTGPWSFAQAAHLLRRTTFGPTMANINEAVGMGLNGTVSHLTAEKAMPEPPIYMEETVDPFAQKGETWINWAVPTNLSTQLNAPRRRSLLAWIYENMGIDGMSIQEKMTLFWQNHFAVQNIGRNEYAYQFLNLIRENALGDFRTLVEGITISPGMLIFLNGNQNTRFSPNENFARELLELFTIGRGPEAGPGDYTNYTEVDVRELARALTGWAQFVADDGTYGSTYIENRHDKEPKKLSPRFDEIEIQDGGEDEYKQVIDIILQKKETARFLCRQLHIWFVGAEIDDEVEENVIEPMASILFDSNYNVKPALEALLKSEYFFDEKHLGCMVNHPLDFIYKMINSLELPLTEDRFEQLDLWKRLQNYATLLEMKPIGLPSVAGWKAFYQAPQFYDAWINSSSLLSRKSISDLFVNGFNVNGVRYNLDLIAFIATLENTLDPNELIKDIAKVIFAQPLSDEQITYLKDVLIPGLPDFEWTVEYTEFLSLPDDEQLRTGVNNKLKALFKVMLTMPEFYLI